MAKRTWTQLGLFLGIAMLALVPARAEKDSVEAELKRARELFSAKKYHDSCKAYQRADELAQGQSAPSLIGMSDCYTQVRDGKRAIAAAHQALVVAANPEERTAATTVLGRALLRQPDEASWTEAATLFQQQVASSGGAQGQGELLTALLLLHRDQEAAEMLQSLRKQGKSEDDLQRGVLAGVLFESLAEDKDERRIDDLNERLLRLDPEAPLRVGGKVKRPEILHQVKPEVPRGAIRSGLSAQVILETIVDTQGNTRVVKIIKYEPMGLTKAAMDAVNAWTFHPATLDGKPVTVRYVLTVHFEVR